MRAELDAAETRRRAGAAAAEQDQADLRQARAAVAALEQDRARLVQALAAALAPLPADADNRAWPFPHVLVSAEGLAVRR